VIVTDVSEETLPVATLNAAADCPAATVTEAGTLAAAALLLVNETFAPPVGATASSVTFAVEDAPEEIDGAELFTEATDVAVVDPPPVPVLPPAGDPEKELPVVPQPTRSTSARHIATARATSKLLTLRLR
jgi:hypothetical protein